MRSNEVGFTLIEMFAVVVIVAVMAAVAVPRFINHSTAAQDVAINTIAGVLTSASSLNHANNLARDAGLSTFDSLEISSCNGVEILLEEGLDKSYVIENSPGISIDKDGVFKEGGSSICLVAFDSNGDGLFSMTDQPRGTFTVYGVRN